MAKSNDMPEFHSVKVSLTENIPAPISSAITGQLYRQLCIINPYRRSLSCLSQNYRSRRRPSKGISSRGILSA